MSRDVPPAVRYLVNADRVILYAGILALLPLLVVIGQFLVPSNWASIWMDQEFSGWVAPIANRLASGQKLYADGAHTPMAPLPYVLMYWLSWGHARWITESALNYECQSLAVLALFAGFHRILPWPAPLIAAFGVVVSFASLPKVIVYDSLAQLFVAVAAVFAVHGLRAPARERTSRVYITLSGVGSGLGLLAKQSTGAGVVVGILLSLWLSRGTGSVRDRLAATARFAVSTAATVLALLVLFSPWIDLRGFVLDVVLKSAEAKGGTDVLWHNLGAFADELWSGAFGLQVPPFALAVALLAYGAFALERPAATPRSPWPVLPAAIGGAIGSALCTVVTVKTGLRPDLALQALLYVSCVSLAVARWRSEPGPEWLTALALFAGVTFPAALAHSLSGDRFRWTYDNNPLVWVPLAFAATLLVQALGAPLRALSAAIATSVLTFAVQSSASGSFTDQWARAADASRTWPQVRFLRGAHMRPRADGMWRVVTTVRQLAPADTDTVFLFPNDPNVEAWFERPRPPVSSCIVFADQYWDRYVDGDFEVLEKHPPRVLVIGPRNFWRRFSHIWQPDRASERLGVLITEKLLPERYTRAAVVPITFGEGDVMDLYVLNDEHPAAGDGGAAP